MKHTYKSLILFCHFWGTIPTCNLQSGPVFCLRITPILIEWRPTTSSTRRATATYMVVLATSFMLISGSALSGQRRMHGAKTMARELGFMRLCVSPFDTLQRQTEVQTLNGVPCNTSLFRQVAFRASLHYIHLKTLHCYLSSTCQFQYELLKQAAIALLFL